jgi:hypothetical protein
MDRIRTRVARSEGSGVRVGVSVGVSVEVEVAVLVGTSVNVAVEVGADGMAVGVERAGNWHASRTISVSNSRSVLLI